MTSSDPTSICNVLRQLAPLQQLAPPLLERLAALGELRSCRAGEVLFSEGEARAQLFLIADGLVHLDMLNTRCGRQTILAVGKGELLGWSALVGDGTMTATAVVVQDSELVTFSARTLQTLLDSAPEVGYRVMQVIAYTLSRRLLATRLQLLDLYHPVPTRLGMGSGA